jgi:two-component system CheB/CheR fusion protein
MSEQRIGELEQELADLRAKQHATEELHRRAENMLAGLQHRVRNLLASVRSLAAHTREYSDDLAEFAANFEGRLAALARCQSILVRSGADRIDLEELLREEFLSHALEHNPRVSLHGDSVQLAPRTAEAIALALHELATNALKYGALSNDEGKVAVSWSRSNGAIDIEWSESGAPGPIAAQRGGFGRELIERGLPFQLGAETSLQFTPSGVHCRISAPVDDAVVGQPE